ncbi:unnamed protein product [Ambrosiozyma monospora]|uniref:Unnamed protein product n=1 Tax=Ambrosiozyma monospora TaxID=43982 RepID=A0ACB5SXU7_AMBMO|nr:unnamed protein product [Ambrosiozyma monospora]
MGQTNQSAQAPLNFNSNVSTPATPSVNMSPSIEPPHKIAKIQYTGPLQPSPTSGNSTPHQQNQSQVFQDFHHTRPYVSSYNNSNGTNNTSSPGCFGHAPSASLSSIGSRAFPPSISLPLPVPQQPQLSHPPSTLGTPTNSSSTSYFGSYHNPSLSTSSLPPLSPIVHSKPNLSNNLAQPKFASSSKITSTTTVSGKLPDNTVNSISSTMNNTTAATVTVAAPLAQLNESILQEISNSKELPDIERFYLKYFVSNVVPVLFSNDSSDSFLRNIVPLALDHKIIRDPIMAIAATHRSFDCVSGRSGKRRVDYTNFNKEDVCMFRDFNFFRSRAKLVGFSYSHDIPKSLTLLSVLLIVIMEVLVGDSLDWFLLLGKANEILDDMGGITDVLKQEKDHDLLLIVVQLFCYLDLVSSLSTCKTPYVEKREKEAEEKDNQELLLPEIPSVSPEDLIDSEFMSWIESDDFDINKMLNTHFVKPSLLIKQETEISELLNADLGFKFGIGGEIFKIIGNISTLASLRNLRHKSQKYEDQFNSLADKIEMRLQNYRTPDYIMFEKVDDLTRTNYALALQWACFLRLHQVRNGYNRSEDRIKLCLGNCLSSIALVPEGSNVESGLLFPLLLAGSVAVKEEDRTFIMSRVASIKHSLRFPYVHQCEKLLNNIWARDCIEGDAVNWAAIRFYEYPGLVTF